MNNMESNNTFWWGDESSARPWNIYSDNSYGVGSNIDHIRFALQMLDRDDRINDMKFLMSWSIDKIPFEGEDVVVVCINEECGLVPRFSSSVKAVFKTGGGAHKRFHGVLGADAQLAALLFARGLRDSALSVSRGTHPWPANLFLIPLGCNLPSSSTLQPLETRSTTVFYAGQGRPGLMKLGGRAALYRSPKDYSRGKLSEAISHLEGDVDIFHSPHRMEGSEYIHAIEDSKICICPRGNFIETWRLYEAARAGCVVITEPLPHLWYFEGFPGIELKTWRDLGSTIHRLLDDPGEMSRLARLTREWWMTRASEEATGRFIAQSVSSL